MEQKIHHGRNLKRFREMLGIKQEALAYDLGEDWNQMKVSLLEQKDTIEEPLLRRLSEVLKIPVEAFENFNEEQTVNFISNTSTNSDNAVGISYNYYPTFNPIDKLVQLYDEKIALYERLLKEKDDLIVRFEQFAGSK